MAENITEYKCDACGGTLIFDAASGKLKCEFCDSLYSIEEMKARYAEENKKVVGKADEAKNKPSNDEMWDANDGLKEYKCQSCGADLVCEATTAATSCPYCGNKAIMPQQFKGMMRPKYVIPFKVDKKEIKSKLTDYYKGKKLLPNSFSDENHIDEVKGVYVPFWLYSGTVEADVSYDAEIEEVKTTDKEKITTTKHYKVHRKGTVDFKNIPTDASDSMPDDLMDSIEPYKYDEMKNFEMEYLLGYIADKYDISKEESKERARQRAEASAVSAADATVENYTSFSEIKHERKIKYSREKEEYAMLPVWLLNTKWENENFLFAVNGQTGEMTGNLPIDRKKQIIRVLAVAIPVLLLVFFFMDMTSTAFIAGLVTSAIAGFVTNSILVGQMKPVRRKETADEYLVLKNGKEIDLSISNDTYINTTESREPIKKD